MKNINTFFKQYYDIHKQEYWFIIFLNLILGIAIWFFQPKGLVQAAVIAFMFLKSMSFARSSSIMPSATSDVDRFSWKYFQGLPLSKREILWSLSLTDLFLVSPLIIWLVAFHVPVMGLFLDDKFESPLMIVKIILFSIPAALIMGFKSFSSLILFPRKQYSKNDPRIEFYNAVKNMAIIGVFILYGGLVVHYLNDKLGLEIGKHLGFVFETAYKNFFSFWSVGFLLLLVIYQFRKTILIWQNEKIGYVKINWNHKRDFSIIAGCAAAAFYLLNSIDTRTPSYFMTPLHKAIYEKNITEMNKLINSGADINQVNKFGFAPIHVAAFTGNEVIFKLLEGMGAKTDIIVESKDLKNETKYNSHTSLMLSINGKNAQLVKYILSKGADIQAQTRKNGQTPLHLAAMNCRFETLDALLDAGAKPNALNKHGETALHRAVIRGCFSAVASLIEAGVDISVKNKDGKLAMDLLPKNHRHYELAHYLEKKSRAPASKITP